MTRPASASPSGRTRGPRRQPPGTPRRTSVDHSSFCVLCDPVQLRLRADDDTPADHRRSGKRHLVQGILAEQLVLGTCRHYERVTVLAEQENLAVVCPGRRREAGRLWRDSLSAINLLAGLD